MQSSTRLNCNHESGAAMARSWHVRPRLVPPPQRLSVRCQAAGRQGRAGDSSAEAPSGSTGSSTLDMLDAMVPTSSTHELEVAEAREASTSSSSSNGSSSSSSSSAGRTPSASRTASTGATSESGNPANSSGRSSAPDSSDSQQTSGGISVTTMAAGAAALAAVATLGATVFSDTLADLVYDLSDLGSAEGWGAGDLLGAALWSASYWYVTPLQLLLLFLGKTDTERPSDWLLAQLGRAAGLRVDAVDYSAPLWLRLAAGSVCGVGGVATAALFSAALGDATWSVSTGIGVCMAAGVYELGRPSRLSVGEAAALEAQWQDFARFADKRLQRSGRCHESEVFAAFRTSHPGYRSSEALPDATLRSMVRNWHPGVERSANGYLKNLSLVPRVDPFTGKAS